MDDEEFKNIRELNREDGEAFKYRPEQRQLADYLDTLNGLENFCPVTPSDLYYGALFAMQKQRATNRDWMGQAAHSLREVFYSTKILRSRRHKLLSRMYYLLPRFVIDGIYRRAKQKFFAGFLSNYFEVTTESILERQINDLQFIFTNLAHHFSDASRHKSVLKKINKILGNKGSVATIKDFNEKHFETLVDVWMASWINSIPRPLNSHSKIDKLLREQKFDRNSLLALFSSSDNKQYFYSKAEERWLGWLWKNGFLDVIKVKGEDQNSYSYRTPELNYLVRMAEKKPSEVVNIILEVPIIKDNLNLEVVDRFLWIAQTLPAEQIARLAHKIKQDEWPKLFWRFDRWGFGFKQIFDKLAQAKDYKSLLLIAVAVLAVKTKEEIGSSGLSSFADSPFYLQRLVETEVFAKLASVDDENLDEAMSLVRNVMEKVAILGDKDRDGIFAVGQRYYLLEVNFFTLKLGGGRHSSYRDDIRSLAAVFKVLITRLVDKNKGDVGKLKESYERYVKPLPNSQTIWRLRLYVLSLAPKVFITELREAFFSIFRADDKPWPLISGAEYQEALRACFKNLTSEDRQKYLDEILKYFGNRTGDDARLWRQEGNDLLSSISADLSELSAEKQQEITKVFGDLNTKFEPHPSVVSSGFAGSIVDSAPQDIDWGASPAILAEKFRGELSPEQLAEKYKGEPFHNPINAEGVASSLKQQISSRPVEFINQALVFFDRDKLDAHYTYSFLRGVEEAVKNGKVGSDVDFEKLVELFEKIAQSNVESAFETEARKREFPGSWLAGWNAVHSAMADVLQALLKGDEVKLINFAQYRDRVLSVLRYLLSYPDPKLEDEKEDRGDIFTIAINTVRGRAFEAFLFFVFHDGKKYGKESFVKIDKDVMDLYEKTLRAETTRSIMFMFGHYLASFFFRNEDWVKSLLSEIFPEKSEKLELYLASWEGYLSSNLYKDFFEKITPLYERAINLDSSLYENKKFFKNIDEGLAAHIALAYLYFDNFNLESSLFLKFWNEKNPKRHKEFISFVGRHAISKDDGESQEFALTKLMDLWDWILANVNDQEALQGFGMWVNPENNKFDLKWLAERIRKTLEVTKGEIEWDYDLMHFLPKLAEQVPQESLDILKLYLSKVEKFDIRYHASVYVDGEIFETLKVLYSKPVFKQQVYELIDKLLPQSNGKFWKLKEIVQPTKS